MACGRAHQACFFKYEDKPSPNSSLYLCNPFRMINYQKVKINFKKILEITTEAINNAIVPTKIILKFFQSNDLKHMSRWRKSRSKQSLRCLLGLLLYHPLPSPLLRTLCPDGNKANRGEIRKVYRLFLPSSHFHFSSFFYFLFWDVIESSSIPHLKERDAISSHQFCLVIVVRCLF